MFCGTTYSSGHVVASAEVTEDAGCINVQVICGECGARGPIVSDDERTITDIKQAFIWAWERWDNELRWEDHDKDEP
jgi:hypothetical protein